MKTIKKIKKVSTAVAGSALLVGATLAGGASMALAQDSGSSGNSYDLGSFPNQPFVEDDGTVGSSVVIGENAKPVDVVSAIDIAAQLGNNAYTTETVTLEGGETTEVNGNSVDVDLLQGTLSSTLTATDYDELVRNYEYGEDEDLRVTEEVQVNSADVTVDDEAKPRTQVEKGEVVYSADYPSGVGVGETLYVLGTEYEVTSADSSELELGSTQTSRNLGTGDSVEHGPWSVEVTDNDGEDTVYLTIKKDGDTVTQDTFTEGEDTADQSFGDDNQFKVSTPSVFFGNEERVTIETTYTDTTVEKGEESPFDEDYDVSFQTGSKDVDGTDVTSVTHLELSNNVAYTQMDLDDDEELEEGEALALAPGESLEGPQAAFTVENMGLTDEATENVEFGEDFQVDFRDANGLEHSLNLADDLNDGSDISSSTSGDLIVESEKGNVPANFEVTGIDTSDDEVTVDFSYGGYEETQTFDLGQGASNTVNGEAVYDATSSGYGFTIALVERDDDQDVSSSDTFDIGYKYNGNYHDADGSLNDLAATSLDTDFNGVLDGARVEDLGYLETTSGSATVDASQDGETKVSLGTDVTSYNDAISGDKVEVRLYATNTDLSNDNPAFTVQLNSDETQWVTVSPDSSANGQDVEAARIVGTTSGDVSTLKVDETNTGSSTTTFDSFDPVDKSGSDVSTGLYPLDNSNLDKYSPRKVSLEENTEGTDSGTSNIVYDYSDNGVNSDSDQGEIAQVTPVSGVGFSALTDVEDGESTLSNYGTTVELGSAESATFMHPENERDAVHAVGSTTTSSGGDQSYEQVTPSGVNGDVASLDSEASTDQDLILVGGPSVNNMTETLAEEDKTWTTDEYTEGQGLLQYIPDAFTDQYDALLVSGESGEDTREAANFLVNHEENADQLEGSTQLSIDTETGQVAE